MLNANEVTVATITLARNEAEEQTLTKALTELARHGLRIVAADGGSRPSFVQFLNGLQNVRVLHGVTGGVWPQAKAAVQAAALAGGEWIVYTEPDKEAFFRSGLPALLREARIGESTGVVMASRSAEGFATFPAFQQMTETAINNCCAEVTGLRADHCYGPFLFAKQLTASLSTVNEDIGWGWRPYTFVSAHRSGLSVSAYENDFFCPEDQRDDDAGERLYRMKQLEQNIRGIVLAAKP